MTFTKSARNIDGYRLLSPFKDQVVTKYKDFDLEKALKGDKFMRLDGGIPEEWHYFETDKSMFPFAYVYRGEIYRTKTNGCFYKDEVKNDNDLVMVPDKKTFFAGIPKDNTLHFKPFISENEGELFENLSKQIIRKLDPSWDGIYIPFSLHQQVIEAFTIKIIEN